MQQPSCSNPRAALVRIHAVTLVLHWYAKQAIVSWPDTVAEPVPFGRTTGWVCNGTNWAYAGLLKGLSKATGLRTARPDPHCRTGISSSTSRGDVCCLKSCTQCGCPGGIPFGPGGVDGCCIGDIVKANRRCSEQGPPWMLGPANLIL